MTEPERRTLRAAIDEARRQRVAAAEPGWEQLDLFLHARLRQVDVECGYCRRPFTPQRGGRFCKPGCKANWYQRQRRRALRAAA